MIVRTTRYSLGPIAVAISGNSEICDLVRSELSALEHPGAPTPSVEFVFSGTDIPFVGAPGRSCALDAGALYAEHSGFRYKLERASDRIVVALAMADPIKAGLSNLAARFRFFNWNYLSPSETLAKNFFYDIFDYVCQIALVESDATFIHASAISVGERCLLISGRGGAGKSTAALNMVLDGHAKYISDDLAILDSSGRAWRSPKKLQVYGYNLKGNLKAKSALLDGRSLPDRLAWHLRIAMVGDKRVRRRVQPEDIFGVTAVGRSVLLGCVVLLDRTDANTVAVSSTTAEALAERNARILMSELAPFGELSAACEDQAGCSPIPTREALQTASHLVLLSALRTCRNVLVTIPQATDPATLLSVLDPIAARLGMNGVCD